MSTPNPNVRFTYDEYKSLPESMEKRYELLDGDLVMVPAPTVLHQAVSRNLEFLLIQFVREHQSGRVFYSPIDVVFGAGKGREVAQPDIVFIGNDQLDIIAEQEIQGAPHLVVEILSPGTEERDQGYKKVLYGRYGVQEYWIVDPKAEILKLFRLTTTGLQFQAQFVKDGTFNSLLLPDLSFPLTEIYRQD
jgi:Uma2 family endonuclease